MIPSRPYAGPADLEAMQDLNAAAVAAVGDRGYLHVGDIAHRLYNGLRHFDPGDVVRLWYDGSGPAAWTMLWPNFAGLEVQTRPDRADLLPELLGWAVDTLPAMVESARGRCDVVVTDVFEGDEARRAALHDLGFAPGDGGYAYTVCDPAASPAVAPPAGFTIRPAAGPSEAEALAAVHAASFGTSWTTAEYLALMASPGYDPGRELVAVAADGRFAAFCIVWFDDRNRVGLFEPVGTADGFRRLGLGRALLAAGMERMRAAGMRRAIVWHEAANPAAARLYASAGFVKRYDVVEWRRPVG